jgi:hypothetical protein
MYETCHIQHEKPIKSLHYTERTFSFIEKPLCPANETISFLQETSAVYSEFLVSN